MVTSRQASELCCICLIQAEIQQVARECFTWIVRLQDEQKYAVPAETDDEWD